MYGKSKSQLMENTNIEKRILKKLNKIHIKTDKIK